MSAYSSWPPRCRYCGLFMGYDDLSDAVSYTPFAGPTALEPPPAEAIHLECWQGAGQERRELTRSIAHSGPHRNDRMGGAA